MKYNDLFENQDLINGNQKSQEQESRILYGSTSFNINESDSIKEGKEIKYNNKWKNTEKEVVNDKINHPLKEESYSSNLDKLLNDDDYNENIENKKEESLEEVNLLVKKLENSSSSNINESDSFIGKRINCNNKEIKQNEEKIQIKTVHENQNCSGKLDQIQDNNDENKKEERLEKKLSLDDSSNSNINEPNSINIGKEINCNNICIKQREEKGQLNIIAIKTVKIEENGKEQESKNKIIYHDGNLNSENPEIKKNLKYIYKDYEFFKDHIDSDVELSKNYDELKEKIKKDDQKIDMIINGKDCEDVIKKLKEDKLYDLINFICVYTSRRKIYEPLKNKYPKIKLITTKRSSIVKFFKTKYQDFFGNSKTLVSISSNFIEKLNDPQKSFNDFYDLYSQQAFIN